MGAPLASAGGGMRRASPIAISLANHQPSSKANSTSMPGTSDGKKSTGVAGGRGRMQRTPTLAVSLTLEPSSSSKAW
eukprot:4329006-Prymnesium_polylepis.1